MAVASTTLTTTTRPRPAYRGVLVGSLLGDAVAVQIRAVDYVAAAVTLTLGVLAVAGVLYLNIRDRAGELTTLRVLGWDERHLGRLVAAEGVGIGLLGSCVGAAAALLAATSLGGHTPPGALSVAAAACLTGVLLAGLATVVPTALLRRLPTSEVLAEA